MKINFNRVTGLQFLYENFPYLFSKNRIALYFVNSKEELEKLKIPNEDFDTFVLKRSGNQNNLFLSDAKCKDNRFFSSLQELKKGAQEFEDIFIFCVECHKFKKGEEYFSDKLAIAQFTTDPTSEGCDRISFIPSRKPGVSTRDNEPYIFIEFPFDSANIFHAKKFNQAAITENGFDDYTISYVATKIERVITSIREFFLEQNIFDTFQLIFRIDSYLNILPIDFRTTDAWIKLNK